MAAENKTKSVGATEVQAVLTAPNLVVTKVVERVHLSIYVGVTGQLLVVHSMTNMAHAGVAPMTIGQTRPLTSASHKRAYKRALARNGDASGRSRFQNLSKIAKNAII